MKTVNGNLRRLEEKDFSSDAVADFFEKKDQPYTLRRTKRQTRKEDYKKNHKYNRAS